MLALRCAGLGEQADLPLEVCGVVEFLVHAGEADVCNLIELAQPLQDRHAYALAPQLRPGGREQFRIMRPMKEVIKQDIPRMIPNPDGHGARIDLDKLGDGSQWK